MSFDSTEAIEALDWSFRPHVDAAGTVPEPSEQAIVRFQRAYLDVIGFPLGADEETRKKLAERLNHASEAAQVAHLRRMRDVVTAVCAGSPTREQIDRLPFRVLTRFADWLYVQLTNPPKPTVATND